MSLWNTSDEQIEAKIDEAMVSRPKTFDLEDLRVIGGIECGNYEKFFDI